MGPHRDHFRIHGLSPLPGRGSEESLTADEHDDPKAKELKERLTGTQSRMTELTADTPVFGGEDQSHAERMRAFIERLVQKLRELFEAIRNAVRGASHAEP